MLLHVAACSDMLVRAPSHMCTSEGEGVTVRIWRRGQPKCKKSRCGVFQPPRCRVPRHVVFVNSVPRTPIRAYTSLSMSTPTVLASGATIPSRTTHSYTGNGHCQCSKVAMSMLAHRGRMLRSAHTAFCRRVHAAPTVVCATALSSVMRRSTPMRIGAFDRRIEACCTMPSASLERTR